MNISVLVRIIDIKRLDFIIFFYIREISSKTRQLCPQEVFLTGERADVSTREVLTVDERAAVFLKIFLRDGSFSQSKTSTHLAQLCHQRIIFALRQQRRCPQEENFSRGKPLLCPQEEKFTLENQRRSPNGKKCRCGNRRGGNSLRQPRYPLFCGNVSYF